jgi:hypothetical protein
MHATAPRVLGRLAGAVAASGLALAGLVAGAAPASAAACSGTTGVTVVVDTGGSTSIRCASGNPSSALAALTGAGFSVTYPQQFPGSVVCRINGFPASDPCVRMPPADAYWAFFHAKRGGGWTYSSSGVASYDPGAGTVVGFRFGSGQQPRVAPPAPSATSAPAAPTTKPAATSAPKATTSAPRVTTSAPKTGTSAPSTSTGAPPSASKSTASGQPSPSASGSPSASVSPSTTTGPDDGAPGVGSGSATPTPLSAAATSEGADDAPGLGTLLAGAGLVALVATGAGWAARKRRP